MKTRPIIFNNEMVRAILDGHKTQTRRVVKYNENVPQGRVYKSQEPRSLINRQLVGLRLTDRTIVKCPYGVPGEKLWVRETFTIETNFNLDSNEAYPPPFSDGRPINWIEDEHWGDHWEQCHYRATDPTPELAYDDDIDEPTVKWKPSIHMPRWASRITLEITDVHVERVQDITSDDIVDEGVPLFVDAKTYKVKPKFYQYPSRAILLREHRKKFIKLWDSLNAKRGYSWKFNPWIWVLEFKIVDK